MITFSIPESKVASQPTFLSRSVKHPTPLSSKGLFMIYFLRHLFAPLSKSFPLARSMMRLSLLFLLSLAATSATACYQQG
jgi:hypothetical protein